MFEQDPLGLSLLNDSIENIVTQKLRQFNQQEMDFKLKQQEIELRLKLSNDQIAKSRSSYDKYK